MSAIQSTRPLSKSQKKAMRKDCYKRVKEVYDEEMDLVEDEGKIGAYDTFMFDFLQSLMSCEFKNSMRIHKFMNAYENATMNEMIFSDNEYRSESVRMTCKNIRANHEMRKRMLYMAMTCDAVAGYWQLHDDKRPIKGKYIHDLSLYVKHTITVKKNEYGNWEFKCAK